MNQHASLRAVVGATLIALAGAAQATDFWVGAKDNSIVGGLPALAGLQLAAGESFSVRVDPSESLWNYSSGAPAFTTGADGNASAPITLLNFDLSRFTAGRGTLVGRIGVGDFFKVGSSFDGVANASGALQLYFWDNFNLDNTGTVLAHVSTVPEPPAALLAGLGLTALGLRRRRKA